jgi:2-polyprenyl-3-methyl-5-hydroxy-6-metoxy-1,4-benzoquinol methylase
VWQSRSSTLIGVKLSAAMDDLQRSWDANARAWCEAVREGKIESRRVATDAAIVDAVMSVDPERVLDLGCGEGWLARQLAARGIAVTGVDASAELIRAANELGGGSFHALPYERLAAAEELLKPPFDVAVANFAILHEDIRPLLTDVARMLAVTGSLIIQTLHPAFASGDEPYADGWRTETFAGIEAPWGAPMPWYFRTISSWVRELTASGFTIAEVREPSDADRARPLSMIVICRAAAGWSA